MTHEFRFFESQKFEQSSNGTSKNGSNRNKKRTPRNKLISTDKYQNKPGVVLRAAVFLGQRPGEYGWFRHRKPADRQSKTNSLVRCRRSAPRRQCDIIGCPNKMGNVKREYTRLYQYPAGRLAEAHWRIG